jgi:hypothetical protein
LYLGEGVSAQHEVWTQQALQVAWSEVPSITGLPLRSELVRVFVFRDAAQYLRQGQELFGPIPAFDSSGCLALTGLGAAIVCDASVLVTPEDAIAAVAHELTHQLIQGDHEGRREVPSWLDEGLAMYAETAILTSHAPLLGAPDGPALAERIWAVSELRVGEAIRSGRYLQLPRLTTGYLHGDPTESRLAYAQSAIAVRWLVDQHGMSAVTQVIRRTGGFNSFDPAFRSVFGYDTAAFGRMLESSLRETWDPPQRALAQPPTRPG